MSSPRYAARHVTLADLVTRRDEWAALGARAIEPNPFYAYAFLKASEDHLHPGRRIDLLIVEDREDARALAALFPLERPHLRDGLPFGARALYRNPYVCVTAPLVRADGASAIVEAALTALERRTARLLLPMVMEDRPFAGLLKEVAGTSGLPLARVDGRARPAVESGLAPEAYRAKFWKKTIRSAERRRLRQLETLGAVEYRRLAHTEPEARHALDAFLALEAKGWKGKQHSALAQRAETAAFARAAFLPAGAGSDILYEVLSLDGVPIAVNINLVAQGVGFALKSTYEEAYARYGIGTLLDGFSLGLALEGGPLARLDSCAPVRHPIRHRWRQEEHASRYLLGLKPGTRVAGLAKWMALIGPYGIWRGADASFGEE